MGVLLTITLALLSLWVTAMLTILATEGQGLRRRDLAVIYILAFAPTLAIIVWLSRRWWRSIHRLPRKFEYECGTCRWVGPCQVSEALTKV